MPKEPSERFKLVHVAPDQKLSIVCLAASLETVLNQGEIVVAGRLRKGDKFIANKRRPSRCSWMGDRNESFEVVYDDRPPELLLKRIRLDQFQRMLMRPHSDLLNALVAIPSRPERYNADTAMPIMPSPVS